MKANAHPNQHHCEGPWQQPIGKHRSATPCSCVTLSLTDIIAAHYMIHPPVQAAQHPSGPASQLLRISPLRHSRAHFIQALPSAFGRTGHREVTTARIPVFADRHSSGVLTGDV